MAIGWGTIMALAGQAASGVMSALNNKKQQNNADAEAARQNAYYEGKANENALSRSENRALLGQYDRKAKQQIENARNMATITGATPEYGLSVQKAVADGRADLMSSMSSEASKRKDEFDNLAETATHQKATDDQAQLAARQETYANLASNAAQSFGSILDSYRTPVVAIPKTATQAGTN
jgi:hypothetical protein